MKPNEKQERLDQLSGYAKALAAAVRVMDERRCILEPLIKDAEIVSALGEKLKNPAYMHAFGHVVTSLFQDLARDLARIGLDEDDRAASLCNLYRKAAAIDIHKYLRKQCLDRARMWHDGNESETDRSIENAQDAGAELFDSDWKAIEIAIADLKNDDVAERLKLFRDKYHAHIEIPRLGQRPDILDVSGLQLKYDDLKEFSNRISSTSFKLIEMLTGNVYGAPGLSEGYRQNSLEMWRVMFR